MSERRTTLLLLAGLIFASLFLLAPGYIRPDSVGTYSYVRSALVDGEFLFFNEWHLFGMIDRGVPRFKEVTATGALANHWGPGTSILAAPFFIVSAPFSPGAFFGVGAFVLALVSVLFTAVTLLATRSVLVRHVESRWALLIPLLTFVATPLFWYTYRYPLGTHAAGAMCVALLVRQLLRSDERRTFGAGLLFGVALAVRIQHIVLFPAICWIAYRRAWRREELISFGGGSALGAAPMLIAWWAIYGTILGPLTGGASSSGTTWTPFQSNALLDVLFSSYHGLLTWSPIVAISLIGLILHLRTDRTLAVAGLLMFGSQWLANGLFDRYFWAGTAFGSRRFVDIAIIFALGAALFVFHSPRVVGWSAIALTTLWSIGLTISALSNRLDLARDIEPAHLVSAALNGLFHPGSMNLRAPVADLVRAGQWSVAIVIVGAVAATIIFAARRTDSTRLAASYLLMITLLSCAFAVRTRMKAATELQRVRIDVVRARTWGPLLDQRKLLHHELEFYERRHREKEAEEVRRAITRVDLLLRRGAV
jgi:hypothetical protein